MSAGCFSSVEIQAVAESVSRAESGRILATLIRLAGSFDRAEEALQKAFAGALTAWAEHGVPANPAAWITAVAQRRVVDEFRRERLHRDKQEDLRRELDASLPSCDTDLDAAAYPDDRLRLIFTCCHPALRQESQVALTLRTLGGLRTGEIAKAFLVPEPTLAQRLVRAKRKIQEAAIPYQVPPAQRTPERLASVQAVVYLIFNEGYAAATGDYLVRRELCGEAIRLGRLLCRFLPREAGNRGLLALMLLHDARRAARVRDSRLVTLEEQDRTLWDQRQIGEGLDLVEQDLAAGPPGAYDLQAAIAALHAQAASPGATDWQQIELLYERLLAQQPSPVVALNHAVAVAMSRGCEAGLRSIDALGESDYLEQYYLFHAARADLLGRLARYRESAAAYSRALELTTNQIEREFLQRRLAALAPASTVLR